MHVEYERAVIAPEPPDLHFLHCDAHYNSIFTRDNISAYSVRAQPSAVTSKMRIRGFIYDEGKKA
jgi:hypothetical protein